MDQGLNGYQGRTGCEAPNVTTGTGGFDEPDHMASAVGVTRGR